MRHERLRGVAVAALSFSIKQYTCLLVSTENVLVCLLDVNLLESIWCRYEVCGPWVSDILS